MHRYFRCMLTASSLLAASALLQTRETVVTIRVEGLPTGVFAPLTVEAPGQAARTFKTAEELAAFSSASPGRYQISGPSFRHPEGWVDAIYDAAPALTQTVAAGSKTTLTYRFQRRSGTGHMLIATPRLNDEDDFSQGAIRGFRGRDLAAGRFAPAFTLITGPRNGFGAVTADGSYFFSDLWDNNRVMRLAPGQIAANGKPGAVGSGDPGDLEVDPQGRLWMTRENVLVGFGRPGGSLPATPPVRLTFSDEDGNPLPIAFPVFRHDGSLLLISHRGLATIPATDLRGVRALDPTWRPFGAGWDGHGIIDAEGNLWMANENGTAYKFPKAQLEGGGEFSPTAYEIPLLANTLALDAEGGVLLLVRASGDLYRLPPNGQAFAKVGNLGTGFDSNSVLTLNPPAEGTPTAALFPRRLAAPE